MKESILEYRYSYLLLFGFIGGAIFFFLQSGYYVWDFLIIEITRTRDAVQIFIASIPVISLLWFFRTYDTKKIIQKNEESITMSLLTKAMDMITENSITKKKLGLLLLAKIKQDNSKNASLANIINLTTKYINLQGVDLSNMNLEKINLSGANLSNAIDKSLFSVNGGRGVSPMGSDPMLDPKSNYFRNYNLNGTNLSGANLSGINLSNAKLFGANLSNAILHNATLCNAELGGIQRDLLYLLNNDGTNDKLWNDLKEVGRANLSGADLNGADLRGARLNEANLDNIKVNGEPLSMNNLNKIILCDENKKLLEDSIPTSETTDL